MLFNLALLGISGCEWGLMTNGSDIGRKGDGGSETCNSTLYPCGPYGTKTREVAANMEFMGFADPMELCKDNRDKFYDLGQVGRFSFSDWYRGSSDPACIPYKKSLLWVMVSAGWCNPCLEEVKNVEEQYRQGKMDPRVGLLNIVFESDVPGTPADEVFLRQWVKATKLTLPVVMDPSFQMGAYFSRTAAPYNLLLEIKTMKIYHQQTGADFATIQQQLNAFFQQ